MVCGVLTGLRIRGKLFYRFCHLHENLHCFFLVWRLLWWSCIVAKTNFLTHKSIVFLLPPRKKIMEYSPTRVHALPRGWLQLVLWWVTTTGNVEARISVDQLIGVTTTMTLFDVYLALLTNMRLFKFWKKQAAWTYYQNRENGEPFTKQEQDNWNQTKKGASTKWMRLQLPLRW